MSRLQVARVASLNGRIRPPSDKSLTHRSFMLAAISQGECFIENPLLGEDCLSTLECLRRLGVSHVRKGDHILISGCEWNQPLDALECGNSGTTVRLLSGLTASRPIKATFLGDASLSRRPMKRISEPLKLMGAKIDADNLPMTIEGGQLTGIHYDSPVASAQIKSCILLAGLRASGPTTVTEPAQSRDHTERMLQALGVDLQTKGLSSTVRPTSKIPGFQFCVPGDISSAAFWMVAAAIVPQSNVTLSQVGINPTRTGILDVFEECGADFYVEDSGSELGEPVSQIVVKFRPLLKPFHIAGDLVPRLIDEIPVLAVLATQCEGTSVIRDARELRVKESDRIQLVGDNLRNMGASVETFEDGMAITGPTPLRAARVEATGDHRIAMAFAVAGLIADGETHIEGADSVSTSYPGFERDLWSLAVV